MRSLALGSTIFSTGWEWMVSLVSAYPSRVVSGMAQPIWELLVKIGRAHLPSSVLEAKIRPQAS